MDISETLAPNSDQLDAVDLLGGPRTFTIERVSKGNAEQPVEIHLAEFPRPWRPGKSMRRVIVACWGPETAAYVGRRVRLYCDESIMFGKDRVGGTRVSHLSHIDAPKSVPLLISRGKSAIYTVEPLIEAPTPAEPTPEQVANCQDAAQLQAWMPVSRPVVQARIKARVAELKPPAEPEPDGRMIPDGPMPPQDQASLV